MCVTTATSSSSGQIVDHHVEHETVELRLGQRIGAFHLDRVLRGQHEERLRQRIAHARRRDLMFLHRLEQRGLRLGRRAVDFVGQNHVGEDRSVHEMHACRPSDVSWRISVPVMSAGMRSGVNWMRWNFRWKICAMRFHEQRLGQPGRAGDQAMAAGEEGDEQLLDHLLLADDDFAQLAFDCTRPWRICSTVCWSCVDGSISASIKCVRRSSPGEGVNASWRKR